MSTPALSEQLDATARAVATVAAGRSLTDALALVPAGLRPGVQALAFHTLRHLGWARAVQALLVPRAPAAHTQALLQVALILLQPPPGEAIADAATPHYEPHTVVNQAVEALRSGPASARRQTALLNACLRRFLRERDALQAHVPPTDEVRWNHPGWWVQRLRRDHPQDWESVLRQSQRPAPMALRVNRLRAEPAQVMQALAQAGVAARRAGADGLLLERPAPVERLPGFREGHWSVQDLAAQCAAPLLIGAGLDTALPPNARVLDACAAPGGKTAHLLEHGLQNVWALDVDPQRCQRIHDNLQRLGLQARVSSADAALPATWWDGQPFDAILLDAPCTASGIVRRHPDVPWLRRPGDVAQLCAQQRALLDALWPLLAPGGRLLYATCSVFRAEGEDQAQAFLKRHTDARRGPAPGHLLPGKSVSTGVLLDNPDGEHDGFYYALFHKPL